MPITFTSPIGGTPAGTHIVSECRDIDAFDLIEPDSIVPFVFKRVASTYSVNDICGIMLDLHYQSFESVTKNKEPNFYA